MFCVLYVTSINVLFIFGFRCYVSFIYMCLLCIQHNPKSFSIKLCVQIITSVVFLTFLLSWVPWDFSPPHRILFKCCHASKNNRIILSVSPTVVKDSIYSCYGFLLLWRYYTVISWWVCIHEILINFLYRPVIVHCTLKGCDRSMYWSLLYHRKRWWMCMTHLKYGIIKQKEVLHNNDANLSIASSTNRHATSIRGLPL